MDFNALTEHLKSNDPMTRDMAVQDMASLGDLRAINVIADFLNQENEIQIIESMLEALKVLFESAPRVLIPLLSNENPSIRNGIIRVLHESGDSVIKVLDELVRNDDKKIRKFALDALKIKKSPFAIASIRSRLNDEDENVKMTAIEYLGGLDDHESAPRILSCLIQSDQLMTQSVCLESLLKLNHSAAGAEAITFLLSGSAINPILESNFFRLLSRYGQPIHLPALDVWVKQKKGEIPREFTEALATIRSKFSNDESADLEKNLSVDTNSDQISENQEDQNMLGDARIDVFSKDTEKVLQALKVLAEQGTVQDIQFLQDLADTQNDDDLLDMISESIIALMSRLEAGE